MRVSVENSSALERRMTISVPADQMEKMINERAGRLGKTVRLPGFRPGKVPRSVIEKRFGQDLLNEVAGELIQTSYQEALGQEGLVPATQPEIEPKTMARGEDLEYTAIFDVYPEIESIDLKGVRIERPVCDVGDAEIDATIDRMRQQRTDFREVSDPAREKDQITIDFTGRIDGVAFEGGAAEDYPLVVGAGAVLPDLDNALVGLKQGDERSVPVAFPDDYPKEDLAGKSADFDITVKKVAVPELPEVDDAFAESFGIAEGGIVKLREEIKANLERELEGRITSNVKDQVMEKLHDKCSFEKPAKMIEDEIDGMIENMRQMMGAAADSAPEPDRSMYREEAERRVSLGLMLRGIIAEREISVDPGKVRERVTQMAAGYEQPEQVVQYYYSDPSRLAQIEAAVLEEQVVETLMEEAEVVDTPKSFDELVRPDEMQG